MSITHIVLFQFKQDATIEAVKNACKQMLSLKDRCIHPSTGKPYIQAAIGGRDNSPEGAQVSYTTIPDGQNEGLRGANPAVQGGITHAFVVEFASATDRDYYVASDPVHQGFVKSLDGLVERAQVVDFTPSVL
ncbi:hypothetical protein BJX64DRAFT_291597 [Aspergillus heterothallicus]